MKKMIVVAALALFAVSCNKTTETQEVKTAYVDTAKLLDESTEAKDIEGKYKSKISEQGADLQKDIQAFQKKEADFKKNVQLYGMVWGQQNAPALQREGQELSYRKAKLEDEMRSQSGVEMEALVEKIKKDIKAYGKEKGYAYIYEAGAVIYTDEKNNITTDIIKLVNEKYENEKSGAKTDEAKAATPAAEAKK